MTTHDDDTTAARAALIAELGLTLSARFVPQSQSRNRDEKAPSLNWSVTLTRAKPGQPTSSAPKLTTNYMQGIGHVPNRPQSFRNTLHEESLRTLYDSAAELGTYPRPLAPNRTSPAVCTRTPLPAPKLDDVLYCLVSDAEAADMTFEDWCANLGANVDSISDKRTYDECVQIGIKLRTVLGSASAVERLRDLFRDY